MPPPLTKKAALRHPSSMYVLCFAEAISSEIPNGYTPAMSGLIPSANASINAKRSFFVTFTFFLVIAVSMLLHPFGSWCLMPGDHYNTNPQYVLVEEGTYFFVLFIDCNKHFGKT